MKDKLAELNKKVLELNNPGAIVSFTREEAELLGAMQEDALTEQEAMESNEQEEENNG